MNEQARRTIASYTPCQVAESAVDRLPYQRFPVRIVAIAGQDVRLVEQVTDRMGHGGEALRGPASGAVPALGAGGSWGEQATAPVVVGLWTTWCGPCHMSPALEQVAADLAGTIKLVKVDTDKNPRLARRLEAQALPTLPALDQGQTIGRQSDAAAEPALRRWVEQPVAGRAPAGKG